MTIENEDLTAKMDIYIDSRGAEMPFMSIAEAFGLISSLAGRNCIDDNDIPFGDRQLASQMIWQQVALSTFDVLRPKLIKAHFTQQDAAKDWPNDLIRADRNLDPTLPLDALKICLSMAADSALDPKNADGVEMADQIDLQQQAIDVITDLIGEHHTAIANIGMAAKTAPSI